MIKLFGIDINMILHIFLIMFVDFKKLRDCNETTKDNVTNHVHGNALLTRCQFSIAKDSD